VKVADIAAKICEKAIPDADKEKIKVNASLKYSLQYSDYAAVVAINVDAVGPTHNRTLPTPWVTRDDALMISPKRLADWNDRVALLAAYIAREFKLRGMDLSGGTADVAADVGVCRYADPVIREETSDRASVGHLF
jgi:hypothetical protein